MGNKIMSTSKIKNPERFTRNPNQTDLKFFVSGPSRVSFPLTPALSPKERENLAQRAAKTIVPDSSSGGGGVAPSP
jgi:hypothetical protein